MPKNPRTRSSRVHVRRRSYHPTAYTIHQVLDYLPDDLDLTGIRAQLRQIADDDSLWELLEEGRVISESRRKIGETIAKRLDPIIKKKARSK